MCLLLPKFNQNWNVSEKFLKLSNIKYHENLFNSTLIQRSPTDGPRENFGGPWRNLDIICNFYVYYTVSYFVIYLLYSYFSVRHALLFVA
jgi:hypothetical protein